MSCPTVITLTTIPPRFALLGPTLRSLMAQDIPAAQILLYVPQSYRRFPDWDGALPVLPDGITLRRCAVDFGPATKLLPALQDFAGQEVDILFCDDDRIYPPGWHRGFKAVRALRPKTCIAAHGIHLPGLGRGPRRPDRMPRMQRFTPHELQAHLATLTPPVPRPPPTFRASGHLDQFEGWAGVMVRPDFFDAAVFDIPAVLWTVDDTWLSGQLERRGIPIWLDITIPRPKHRPDAGGVQGLLGTVIDGHGRVAAETACITYFREKHGIWAVIPPPTPPSALRRLARRVLPHRLRLWIRSRLRRR